MGWSPAQVDACEPYQFAAAYRGWRKAHAPPSGPKAPSDDEFRRAIARTVH